jgi:hypothetical protein
MERQENKQHSDAKLSTPDTPHSTPQTPDLEQVWQQILAYLQRSTYSLYSLLNQHGHLISFDGVAALIGIRAEPLLKRIQQSLGEVEVAFEKVCNQKVRVSLRVAASKSSQTGAGKKSGSSIPTSEPTPPGRFQQPTGNYPPQEQERRSESESVPPSNGSLAMDREAALGASELAGARPHGTVPSQRQEENSSRSLTNSLTNSAIGAQEQRHAIASPIPPTTSVSDWDDAQVDQALDHLKQFFEGEIIDLTEDIGEGEPAITQKPQLAAGIDGPTQQLEKDALQLNLTKPTTPPQIQSSGTNQTNSLIVRRPKDWQYDESGDLEF